MRSSKPSGSQYDVRDLIACIWTSGSEERGRDRGSRARTLTSTKPITGSRSSAVTRRSASPYGIVANQKKLVQRTVAGGKTGPTKGCADAGRDL